MEICKTFDVQHVHLIHKQHTGYELSNTLVYIAVHHLVDLSTQLICIEKVAVNQELRSTGEIYSQSSLLTFSTCDFCLFGLHQLSHHGENVLASLRGNNEPFLKRGNIKRALGCIQTLLFLADATVIWQLCTWGRALATSRSWRVTSWTISFFLWTSPLGSGTYSSASRSNSVAKVSQRPCLCRDTVIRKISVSQCCSQR